MGLLGNSYFRDQVFFWRITGAEDLSRGKFWGWSMVVNLVAASVFPTLAMTLFSYENPLENITNFSLTITSLATTVKFGLYVRRLSLLQEIEHLIVKLNERVIGEEQVRCHRQMGQRLHLISRVFMTTFAIVIVSLQASFIFKDERSLPFPSWFPLDWKNSVAAYAVAVLYQNFVLYIQTTQNYVGDSFPPLALYLVSQQCKLLNLRIMSIGFECPEDHKGNQEELVRCIKDQERLYRCLILTLSNTASLLIYLSFRLLELTRRLITWPLLVQFIVIAINVGLTVLGLVMFVQTVFERIYYAAFLVGISLEIYPICYYGTIMEDSFNDLHYAIFCSNWLEQSRSTWSTILIISERTKRQQRLFAGNIVPLHLDTFAATCKAAYSFFTLMANTMQAEENQD
ncbi:hypothetical protein KR018_008074 [Drosophila ironensis]|nr:hypothetical protein KR018_008074 [Drosophila ironensis]